MVHAFALVFDVPLLIMLSVHTSPVPAVQTQLVTLADTWAVFVNDPKRPKTKPAMAIAAIKVIAIRMTVARTGEIAFLLPAGCVSFIVVAYGNVPVKDAEPPFDKDAEPV